MNGTNFLADVAVPEVVGTFSDMYIAQVGLQNRLNQLPMDITDFKHMATRCIYWGHCIRAEIEELTVWLGQQTDPTWIKEMQMEAIDIMHFVFNLGIEIGLTDADVHGMSLDYDHQDWLIDNQRIMAAVAILSSCTIKLIDLLPWKTWKTYTASPDMPQVTEAFMNIFRAALMLCNACDLSEQAIINMYFAKNKVNHLRQDNGY